MSTQTAATTPAARYDRARLLLFAKLLFAVAVWGGSFVATKIALREAAPMTVVWLRFGLGVAVLGMAVATRRQFAWLPRREVGYFALLGLLGITFHQWLQANGLVTAQATTSAWIVATTPVFMAILAVLVLKEKLGWTRSLGILLAGAGVLLVVTRGDVGALTAGRFGQPGDLLMLISAPNWAVFAILSRHGLRRHPAARMIFFVMAFGWLFITPLFLAGPGLADLARLGLSGWLGVGFLGIFCSGLAYIYWYDALERLPASQVGVFLYLEPIATVAVAAALLGEGLAWAVLLGGAIILLGVWLVNRPARPALPVTKR